MCKQIVAGGRENRPRLALVNIQALYWTNHRLHEFGGDEFTILIPGLTGEVEINVFLDALRKELSEPAEHMVYISECSASIGCARFPLDGNSFEQLLKRADIAMYHAKKGGKNKACMYNDQIGSLTATEIRRDVLIAIIE